MQNVEAIANGGAEAKAPAFFISRAGRDKDIAQRIAHILESAGHPVIIQDWDFQNRAFMERIHAALTSGARTIALLSPDYLARDHCSAEWQNTVADDPLNRESKLIVLRIRPCDPVGLLKSFAYWDVVPLLAPGQEAMLRDVVVASVRTGRQKDPLSPVTRYVRAAQPILSAEIKPVPNFTGREAALEAIEAALARSAQAAITQATAVHGLGGIGKSMLAREFACRAAAAGRYAGVWWLRAEKSKDSATWDGIEQGLGELRAVLYPGLEPPKERAKAARDTLNFLSTGGFEKPWLLVYDNVDDKELLDAWAPPAPVQVLITSRLGRWGAQIAPVEVEEWTRDEATRYLREASGRPDLSAPSLAAIADGLGGLPLALSHAAAYLQDNAAVTAEDYLASVATRMKEAPEGVAYKASVFATFQLAMAQAEAKVPGAKAVLTFASFFAPDNIPEELFTLAPELYPPPLRPLATNIAQLREAIGALDRLSLVDFDPVERTFSVHRLVQAAARDSLASESAPRENLSLRRLFRVAHKAPSGEAEWIASAVKACNAADAGEDFEDWKAYEHFLPHVRAVSLIASDDVGAPLASMLNMVGFYLRRHAAYVDALPFHERAVAIREKALGPDHPDVATSLNNLATLHHDQAGYDRALPLYERALSIREKALGPDHPDVATSLRSLATLHNAQGAYERALPLFERAQAIFEKALGPDHPDVALSLNNLAELYRSQGTYNRALPLYERAQAIFEKALGQDDSYVALSLNNLATLYQAQGAYDRALPTYERALAILEKALGPDHPNVATSLNNLAELYSAQGTYDRALRLYERALAITEKALGPDHRLVGTVLNNLAQLYRAQGAYERAFPFYERALAINEKALGPDHPDVAISLNNLADLYRDQGAYDHALPFYERALAIAEKALGSDHPDVATLLNNYALLDYVQAGYDRALPLFERVLAILEKTLGPDHPRTKVARSNLAAALLSKAGRQPAEPGAAPEKVSRNDPCPCGSGKRYKHCHGALT